MDEQLKAWSSRLVRWAQGKPEISELWLFGSRVRGDFREDSDLDVAVVMVGGDEGDRLGNWICLSDEWETELNALIPVKVDLDLGDEDISKVVVAPALKREGIRIFFRGENE